MVRTFSMNEMCDIQNHLNEITVGKNWKDELTIYDFQAAAFDEVSELLRTYNWKWWNNKPASQSHWNAGIEIIDILHFLISIKVLANHQTDRDDVFVIGSNSIRHADDEPTFIHAGDKETIRFLVARIGNWVGMMTNATPMEKTILMDSIVRSLPLSQEMVSAVYQAKAALNEVRQSSGYKEGKYDKYAKGKEDNEILKDVVDAFIVDDNMSLNDVRRSVFEEFGM